MYKNEIDNMATFCTCSVYCPVISLLVSAGYLLSKHKSSPSLSQVVWQHGFGYADLENKLLAGTGCIMRIASIRFGFGIILI